MPPNAVSDSQRKRLSNSHLTGTSMHAANSILAPSLRDLRETLSDFKQAPYQTAERMLGRLVQQLDEEPLAGFLRNVLPAVDFATWFATAEASVGSMVGSGVLDWPAARPERVAIQISLCRAIVGGRVRLLDFARSFFYSGNELSANCRAFAAGVLEPLIRDIDRLTEDRAIPPILFEAMGQLPTSGDSTLDGLLKAACERFKDPAPGARADAIEKLWDAWERLKTIEVVGDKKASVTKLLELAAPEPTFRAQLEAEAKALTAIGNAFHIRHFETDKVELKAPAHLDYLFHRLYALIHLLLFSRGGSN